MVIVDLPCRQCGYNVRGLAPGGVCPECGRRVALSLRGDLLRYSQPRWVRKLQRGVELLLLDVGLAMLAGGIGRVVGLTAWGKGNALLLTQMLHLAAAFLGFVGSWWLTEPDPGGVGEDDYGRIRKLIRVTLLLGAAQSVYNLIITRAGATQPWALMSIQVINFALQIAAIVGLLATLQYLRRLSMRIPDLDIAGRARFLMYALGACCGVLKIAQAVLLLIGRFGGPAPVTIVIGSLTGAAGLALVVFLVMGLFLLFNLRARFLEQAAMAEQVWQEPAAPMA